ncbi:MAG: glycosyltransferase family 4 protein [Candidatus Aminicenantes bacterium]|nr:glycosyltransferase family 4 protein [Candidatus Aminicenantes bacterium]
MKILIVHNKYQLRSGEEKVLENESRLLKEHGHKVDFVIFDNRSINSKFSKIRTGFFSFYNPASAKLIRKKIAILKPDVIHVHNFFPILSPSVFFRKTRGNIPVIMTIHNYRLICANAVLFRKNQICTKCVRKRFPIHGIVFRCYRNSFLQTLNLVLLTAGHNFIGTWRKKIDRFIALTEFQRNTILNSSLNLKDHQIIVKPNFSYDKGLGNISKDDYFIYLGRLELDKGIDTLLSAFEGTEYKLKIFGGGSMAKVVTDICNENNNMDFFGFKDSEHVLEQLKFAKGLIFPSNNFEGFPMAISEAFSCGTPVITSDIGSQAEIITDGFNGLHFRINDPEDLREKIEILSNTTDNLFNINARKTYEKLYNDKRNYESLVNIYRELLVSDSDLN